MSDRMRILNNATYTGLTNNFSSPGQYIEHLVYCSYYKRFYLVGYSETYNPRVVTTTDGYTFVSLVPYTDMGDARCVATDNSGTIVVAGNNGLSAVSTNGTDFTHGLFDASSEFLPKDIEYHNGEFIICGINSSGGTLQGTVMFKSTDGVNWTEHKISDFISDELYMVSAPDGNLYAFNDGDWGDWDPYIAKSTDGVNWTKVTSPYGFDKEFQTYKPRWSKILNKVVFTTYDFGPYEANVAAFDSNMTLQLYGGFGDIMSTPFEIGNMLVVPVASYYSSDMNYEGFWCSTDGGNTWFKYYDPNNPLEKWGSRYTSAYSVDFGIYITSGSGSSNNALYGKPY